MRGREGLDECLMIVNLSDARAGKLVNLQPPVALLCSSVSAEPKEVPVGSLRTGDLCKILPGSTVPVDGIVTSGTTYIDESMITGEVSSVHTLLH